MIAAYWTLATLAFAYAGSVLWIELPKLGADARYLNEKLGEME